MTVKTCAQYLIQSYDQTSKNTSVKIHIHVLQINSDQRTLILLNRNFINAVLNSNVTDIFC